MKKLTPAQIIVLGFAGIILLGAFILMLPISSTCRGWTPFNEALFTSTTSVCVTGLVVQDTGSYWTSFGHMIIMLLIQIGGLGVVTVAASFALFSGRRISLHARNTIVEATSSSTLDSVTHLTKYIIRGTLLVECLGALVMMPVFCADYGLKGIWYAFFHSVSAFCNAGIDLLGWPGNKFPSLTGYVSNATINITIMSLIILGGLGFLTWEDMREEKFRFSRYRLQSKVILVSTLCLITLPAIYFFFYDFASLPLKSRILASLFQSVTPRTAGFNTVDLASMSSASQGISIMLMLIGASPGSTGGGMKNTTFTVLLMTCIAVFRRKKDTEIFGRRIEIDIIKNAATIAMMYVVFSLLGAIAISTIDGLPIPSTWYDTASAIGTVGSSLGITPKLSIPSRYILICLMFFGRVGGLTIIYAAFFSSQSTSRFPEERITVG
ncbi:MAG: potassium transporter TrkG [Synergistaceae bacterium]|nr:potassium transporter TrkG [Synergistaceae bacterium]